VYRTASILLVDVVCVANIDIGTTAPGRQLAGTC
jgi:hypothetical protein